MEFRFCDVHTLLSAARVLMERHARDFHIKDLDMYIPQQELLNLERYNLIVAAAAIDAGNYIGYIVWLIAQHQGLDGLVGKMGPWYVIQSRRGIGIKLFRFSLAGLRSRGCKFALPTMPISERRRRSVLGKPFEMTYLLEL